MTKSELRKIFLERRRSMSLAEAGIANTRIADQFFTNIDLNDVKLLHTFLPIKKFAEVDTTVILSGLAERFPNIRIAVPKVDFKIGELENRAYSHGAELLENGWGIPEPRAGETVDPLEIDLILLPLVCFDESGHRVGYGKGYYDRFLKNCRADCRKVGLSFFEPVVEIDGRHEGDVRLDVCITPDAVYKWPPGSED